MIPKIIHMCWFSNDPYPVEIKVCMDSWKRVLPDYEVRLWTFEDAKSIGCPYIDQALEAKRWAFAADAVRFYAVYSEGGVYMDSDIYIMKRFDHLIPEKGFVTFFERVPTELQAAFLIGEKGNTFCKEMYEHYLSTPFMNADGSLNEEISPVIMFKIAQRKGCKSEIKEQHLADDTIVYPEYYVKPRNRFPQHPDMFAQHRIYGSWRKRKLGRRIELYVKHLLVSIRYALTGR